MGRYHLSKRLWRSRGTVTLKRRKRNLKSLEDQVVRVKTKTLLRSLVKRVQMYIELQLKLRQQIRFIQYHMLYIQS